MRKYILPALLCLIPMSLFAFDVYFFRNTAPDPVTGINNVKKIVFSTTGTTVTDVNGTSTSVALTDADFISFNKSAGVGNVAAADRTSISLNGTTLSVTSDETLGSVEIIAVNGATVANYAASGHAAVFDLSPFSAGVYMVRVITGSSASVKKIIIAE